MDGACVELFVHSYAGGEADPSPVTVAASPVRVGRSPDCDLRLEDPERLISRRHLDLWHEAPGRVRVRNISSSTPAFVDAEILAPGETGEIGIGQRLMVGRYVLSVRASERTASSATAAPVGADPVAAAPFDPAPAVAPAWLAEPVRNEGALPLSDAMPLEIAPVQGGSDGGALLAEVDRRGGLLEGLSDDGGGDQPALTDDPLAALDAVAPLPPSRLLDEAVSDPVPLDAAPGAGGLLDGLDAPAGGRAVAAGDAVGGEIDALFAAPSVRDAASVHAIEAAEGGAFDAPVIPAQGPDRSPPMPPPAPVPSPAPPVPVPSMPAQPEIPAPAPVPADPATATAPLQAPAPNTGDRDELLGAFARGCGLPVEQLRSLDAATLQSLGGLLAALVRGTLQLVHARSSTKHELRANVTIIASSGNNPLKFAPDSQAALLQLLGRGLPGFMAGEEAVVDAFDDLSAHQVGLLAASRSALYAMGQRLSPERIESEHVGGGVAEMLPGGRKAALWDRYSRLYATLLGEAREEYEAEFQRAFVQAYENEIGRLRGGARR